ncbi:MAG: LapA family protein [Actinomycetota bacterium]|nr:LapA family protein [Actinomycetota bacterium]
MRREGDQPPGADDPELQHDRDQLHELQKSRQRRVAKLLVALFISVVLIVFIIQNSERVKIHYVFFTANNRLIWVMLACAILGGVVGYLIGRPGKQVRLRHRPDQEPKPKPEKNKPS